jgi:hypothetical protein
LQEHLLEPNPKLGLFYSAPEWNNAPASTAWGSFSALGFGVAPSKEQPSTFVELTQLRPWSEISVHQ